MTIKQLLEIKNNPELRDNYLIKLTKRNKQNIYNFSKKIAGNLATYDIISCECTQYFMLGANRGIEQAKIISVEENNTFWGGKYDPEQYIFFRGTQKIRNFLMTEFKLRIKHNLVFESLSSLSYKYNISSTEDYIQEAIDNINIKEIIEKLKPLDRYIINILLYGEFNNKDFIPNLEETIVTNIANSLNYGKAHIYERIKVLRSVFTTIVLN